MKFIKLFLSIIIFGSLTNCATISTKDYPFTGLYLNIYEPMLIANTGEPIQKTGKACSSNILGLFVTGNGSIGEAAKQGNITKVIAVDKQLYRFLIFYSESCTIVHGN